MPRKDLKARDRKNVTIPDPVFKSLLVSRFINKMLIQGKKSLAERLFYDMMDFVKKKTSEEPLNVFTRAMENIRPLLEVKARRVGGATYQVPCEVVPERGTSLAMRWILENSRAKSGKPFSEKLGEEVILGAKKEGASMKKREDTHRMAEANKAFAHYRW